LNICKRLDNIIDQLKITKEAIEETEKSKYPYCCVVISNKLIKCDYYKKKINLGLCHHNLTYKLYTIKNLIDSILQGSQKRTNK